MPTRTSAARMGFKAAVLLALGAGVALLEVSCFDKTPLPDPYYHSCLAECVRYPSDSMGYRLHPVYAWFGKASEAPDCASVGLYTAEFDGTYGDLKETDRCPRCLCEARPCPPPARIAVTWKSKPENDACEEVATTFADTPPGWDGGCFAPQERFAEKAGRVVDVYSFDRLPDNEPCGAYLAPEDVDAIWGTFAVMCDGTAYGPQCDDLEKSCVQPKPEGFRACMRLYQLFDDLSASCPPEFPERHELYRELGGCSDCFCHEMKPRECEMTVSLYEDKDCTQHISTRPLPAELGECVDTPGEVVMKSLSVAVVKEERGTCAPVGGGRVSPSIPIQGEGSNVYCCEPAPGG
ncbi:hypothetical protein WMF45_03060 [Sorangium sp. So ce448]|uniref:hypothetical protein n=1 Tax=Sorangium sp. So ce448 TaxID=3133314 RepID=UPI003F5FF6B8